jgi:hypothetical protein
MELFFQDTAGKVMEDQKYHPLSPQLRKWLDAAQLGL